MRDFVTARVMGMGRTLVNMSKVHALIDNGDGTTQIVFENRKHDLVACGEIGLVVDSIIRQQDAYDDIQHGKYCYRNSHPLSTKTKGETNE
jgi:regulator of RNase E activity RraA